MRCAPWSTAIMGPAALRKWRTDLPRAAREPPQPSRMRGARTLIVYFVGESGTILRCSANTGTCSTLAAGLVSRKFAAVWGSDADHIFAVADIGVIVRCIAESCQQLTTNTNSSFTSVRDRR